MKEIIAFIRVNKVAETREALELNGFYGYTCRKCMGRGKNQLSSAGRNLFLATDAVQSDSSGGLMRSSRLIAKRMFLIEVADEDVSKAVNIIIKANQTGNVGDGKIFVRDITESYIVRTGEKT